MVITVALQRQLLRRQFRQARRALGGSSPRVAQKRRAEIVSRYKSLSKRHINKHIDILINFKYQKSKPFSNPQKQVVAEQKAAVPIPKAKAPVSRKRSLVNTLFVLLSSLSLAALLILFVPAVYYRFVSPDPVPVRSEDAGSVLGGDFKDAGKNKVPEPEYDETLPEGNWIIIPRIGVRTEILESQNPEESLAKGVWRVPDFGQPGDQSLPIIVAAHRYGYNWWWKGEYWKYHSFYLLPNIEPGDIVEVISNKRKYIYEVYGGEEGTEIQDYYADMILYTCKYLTSDLRHFRYARLIDPSKYLPKSGNVAPTVQNSAPESSL